VGAFGTVWKALACILIPVAIEELRLRRAWRRVADKI
jgi:hypothetical protein